MSMPLSIAALRNGGRPLVLGNCIPGIQADTFLFAAAVVILNLPLVLGGSAEGFILTTHNMLSGEWWRLLTHPFVHVSWYHLFLDGSAFFILYNQLSHKPVVFRLSLLATCLAGSVGGALVETNGMIARGLCGLSGSAHGLMAYCALESLAGNKFSRWTGGATLLVLAVKSLYEWITGIPFLNFLHFGNIGDPILATHLGGVVAAVLFFLVMLLWRQIGGFNRSNRR